MRAIEDGRWIVHAAVSGISAFIDPTGRVYDQTELFAPEVIRRTIHASSESDLVGAARVTGCRSPRWRSSSASPPCRGADAVNDRIPVLSHPTPARS